MSRWRVLYERWLGDRRWFVLLALVCVLLVLAAFGATLGGYFLCDDFGYVSRFAKLGFHEWPRLFVREWSEGIWGMQLRELRPVTALTFMVDARLWGAWAPGYHITNLLIHSACSVFTGILAWRVSGGRPSAAFIAAALFALYPVHAEPITWITGRVDMVATLGCLATLCAWWVWRKTGAWLWLVLTLLAFFLAAFAKEFALLVPLLMLLGELCTWRDDTQVRGWRRLLPYLGFVAVFVFYSWCRKQAFGAGGGVPVPAYTTAVFWKEFCERQWFYLRSLLGEPLTLGLGLAKNSRAETIVTWAVLSLLVLLPLVFRRRLGAICWALWAWYAVATIPLVVTYVSGRHLYYASVGLCVVLGSLLVKAPRLPRWLGASVLAVLFFLSAQKTQSSWNDSGRLSGETMAAVKSALSATKPGTPIFYDVSTTWEGAWNWAWASPFVVQDFFIKRELTQDRIFIETPGAYYNADYWWDRKDIKGLPAKAHLGVAFVFASAPGQVKVHFVGEKAFRPVAERLAAGNLNPDLWQWTVTTLRDAAAK